MQQGYAQSTSSMVKRAILPCTQATTLLVFQMPTILVLSMQKELCQDETEGHLLQGWQSLKTQGLALILVTERTLPSVRPPVPPALLPVLVSLAWTCSALLLHWCKTKLQTSYSLMKLLFIFTLSETCALCRLIAVAILVNGNVEIYCRSG